MHELPDQWLAGQGFTPPKEVDTDSAHCGERLAEFARACSLRLAIYQAVAELVAAGELIAAGPPSTWQASLGYHTSRGAGGIRLEQINCSFPARIERPPLAPEPAGEPDVFLNKIELATLGLPGGPKTASSLERLRMALIASRRQRRNMKAPGPFRRQEPSCDRKG